MLSYTLPEGFRWIVKSRDDLLFEHIATEERARVSHCERAVTPDDEIQRVVDYQCARTIRKIALDKLWFDCGGDRGEFERRKPQVLKG